MSTRRLLVETAPAVGDSQILFERCEMKNELTVYMPEGNKDTYEVGKDDVADIMQLNDCTVAVVYTDSAEVVFSGMPFVFRH